ncbi:MAG: hypothetical protein LBR86_02405 [Tannerella sp.]|nr:hypothetical protein [Tannerella sp.]
MYLLSPWSIREWMASIPSGPTPAIIAVQLGTLTLGRIVRTEKLQVCCIILPM